MSKDLVRIDEVEVVDGELLDDLVDCARCGQRHGMLLGGLRCCLCGEDHDPQFCCGCGHFHGRGGPCLAQAPCGDYRCCIN